LGGNPHHEIATGLVFERTMHSYREMRIVRAKLGVRG